jgi:hypothetical protein
MKKRLLAGAALALLVPGLPPPAPVATSSSDGRLMVFLVMPLLLAGIASSAWLIIRAAWNLWRGSRMG